ncbi:DUF3810 domain-containing protein [Flavobacteriaceae bacterium]|nr:DUF3810 domain-containing protein [Flavobacteriaceae bacterium]
MKIRSLIAIALIPQILIVNFLRNNPSFIDDYYVRIIFNNLIKINSFLFSKIEIPIGEIIYIVIIILYIYLFVKVISFKLSDFLNLVAFSSILYFLFYFLWGLNYFKPSLVDKLNINSEYEFNVLDETINRVIFEINKESSFISEDINKSDIFNLINTTASNIKKSIIPDIFLYQKVSGHYIPFTSEAIFVDKIPLVDMPIVILHEQAHQSGYANEGEASFIAFSKAINNKEPYIRYSGYFYALINLLNEISKKNSDKLDNYITKLDEKVISDIKKVQNFWSKYSNSFLDKAQNYIYDLYLKSNNQEAGIMTYGEVSIYIIHYYQKL